MNTLMVVVISAYSSDKIIAMFATIYQKYNFNTKENKLFIIIYNITLTT